MVGRAGCVMPGSLSTGGVLSFLEVARSIFGVGNRLVPGMVFSLSGIGEAGVLKLLLVCGFMRCASVGSYFGGPLLRCGGCIRRRLGGCNF